MTIENLLKVFIEKPYLVKMGKGSLSKRLRATPKEIMAAKKAYYAQYRKTAPMPKILILDIETAPHKAFV